MTAQEHIAEQTRKAVDRIAHGDPVNPWGITAYETHKRIDHTYGYYRLLNKGERVPCGAEYYPTGMRVWTPCNFAAGRVVGVDDAETYRVPLKI